MASFSTSNMRNRMNKLHQGGNGRLSISSSINWRERTSNNVPVEGTGGTLPQLFNKTSFNKVSFPYRTFLTAAAGRWSSYLKFNKEVYDILHGPEYSDFSINNYTLWNGIELGQYNEYSNPNSGTIASCAPIFVEFQTPQSNSQFATIYFTLSINTHYFTAYNKHDWNNILTHELGHALGIGSFWIHPGLDQGSPSPVNNFLDSISYPNTQLGYNFVTSDSSYTKIPVEAQGGPGTLGAHWENNFRPSTDLGSEGKNYPGVKNELMVGQYYSGLDLRISKLTLGALKDFGWVEKNPGVNEGALMLETTIQNSLIQGAPAGETAGDSELSDVHEHGSKHSNIIKCCKTCSDSKCLGTLIIKDGGASFIARS